jgi:hypothetical protein
MRPKFSKWQWRLKVNLLKALQSTLKCNLSHFHKAYIPKTKKSSWYAPDEKWLKTSLWFRQWNQTVWVCGGRFGVRLSAAAARVSVWSIFEAWCMCVSVHMHVCTFTYTLLLYQPVGGCKTKILFSLVACLVCVCTRGNAPKHSHLVADAQI